MAVQRENLFEYTKGLIEIYCNIAKIHTPEIIPSLETDICDFTDYNVIRLNIDAYCENHQVISNNSAEYYAFHVFGHYLAGLHELDEYTDIVADFISHLIKRTRE